MVDDVDSGESEAAAFVAFAGAKRVAAAGLGEKAVGAKRALESGDGATVVVFETATGQVVDLDLRGSDEDVLARYAPVAPVARRGRPKLGVVAREVTLLPRHWEWLAGQPGGASIALRKLVEAARKGDAEAGQTRVRIEAAYKFMSAMAGDLPGFEDAARHLFSGDLDSLRRCIEHWPQDIADQLLRQLLIKGRDTAHV